MVLIAQLLDRIVGSKEIKWQELKNYILVTAVTSNCSGSIIFLDSFSEFFYISTEARMNIYSRTICFQMQLMINSRKERKRGENKRPTIIII